MNEVRDLIEQILTDLTVIPYSFGDIQFETVFDRQQDRYLLMVLGWDQGARVHSSLVHLDIINGKIWVQRDGTERGVTKDLVESGVPKDRIVLAFRSPTLRAYGEYAVW